MSVFTILFHTTAESALALAWRKQARVFFLSCFVKTHHEDVRVHFYPSAHFPVKLHLGASKH